MDESQYITCDDIIFEPHKVVSGYNISRIKFTNGYSLSIIYKRKCKTYEVAVFCDDKIIDDVNHFEGDYSIFNKINHDLNSDMVSYLINKLKLHPPFKL
jgi:hypothetical protein